MSRELHPRPPQPIMHPLTQSFVPSFVHLMQYQNRLQLTSHTQRYVEDLSSSSHPATWHRDRQVIVAASRLDGPGARMLTSWMMTDPDHVTQTIGGQALRLKLTLFHLAVSMPGEAFVSMIVGFIAVLANCIRTYTAWRVTEGTGKWPAVHCESMLPDKKLHKATAKSAAIVYSLSIYA